MTALVLLPGMDGSGAMFAGLIAALGPDIRCIVASYPTDQAMDYGALEAIARSFLPADGPFVVLAESFSGPIGISIAASAPPGLRGLILSSSFARNPRDALGVLKPFAALIPVHRIPTSLSSRLLLGRFSTAALRMSLTQAVTAVSPAAMRARLEAVLGVDVSALLARILVPVLYLRASEDRVVPRSAGDHIVRTLPSARLAEVTAPHFLLQVAPAESARIISGFLQEVTADQG